MGTRTAEGNSISCPLYLNITVLLAEFLLGFAGRHVSFTNFNVGDVKVLLIKKALQSLPKTLDETYEKIFLGIPSESRNFVIHALLWIHFNSTLDLSESSSGSLTCDCLLQAIYNSMASQGMDPSGEVTDREVLRELCACLIDIRNEEKLVLDG
jgi:hypothetical protein